MSTHLPEHHPEFPLEKGKPLPKKVKMLLTNIRSVVLDLLDGKNITTIKLKDKFIDMELPYLDDNRKPGETRDIAKNIGKEVAKTLNVDSKKVLTRVSNTIAWQYKHMSAERFLHRYENGKVMRDMRYILGIMHLTAGYGSMALSGDIGLARNGQDYPTLKEKSKIHKAFFALIHTGKETLPKKEFDQMINEFKGIIPSILSPDTAK